MCGSKRRTTSEKGRGTKSTREQNEAAQVRETELEQGDRRARLDMRSRILEAMLFGVYLCGWCGEGREMEDERREMWIRGYNIVLAYVGSEE